MRCNSPQLPKELESKIIGALLSDHPSFVMQSHTYLHREFSSTYLPPSKQDYQCRHMTSLLTIAAAYNKVASVRRLLEFGASPDGLNNDETPPLTTTGSIEVIKLLTNFGANPNITTHNGTTSAILVHIGNHEIFNYLINHGAEINMKNCNHLTALGFAISLQFPIADISFLIDSGADIYNIGIRGESAFEILCDLRRSSQFDQYENTPNWIKGTEELLRLKILAGIIL